MEYFGIRDDGGLPLAIQGVLVTPSGSDPTAILLDDWSRPRRVLTPNGTRFDLEWISDDEIVLIATAPSGELEIRTSVRLDGSSGPTASSVSSRPLTPSTGAGNRRRGQTAHLGQDVGRGLLDREGALLIAGEAVAAEIREAQPDRRGREEREERENGRLLPHRFVSRSIA